MRQFGKLVLLTLSFGLVAVVLSSIPGSPAGATSIQSVNVVNTPGVNVVNTPSVNVANTPGVLAQITNTPSVNANITNSPVPVSGTVALSGTPTVNLGGGTSVGINNTSTSPVLARDVDNPARSVFQIQMCEQTGSFSCGPGVASFTVSSGKQLVIEYISGRCVSGVNSGGGEPTLTTAAGGVTGIHFFPVPLLQPSSRLNFAQQTRIYADPNTSVILSATPAIGDSICTLELSGSQVSVP